MQEDHWIDIELLPFSWRVCLQN